jgi:inorganic pyrophosphatase
MSFAPDVQIQNGGCACPATSLQSPAMPRKRTRTHTPGVPANSTLQPAWYSPFHLLAPGEHAPEEVNAFIECPMRSKIKYELDKRNGILHISRTLHSAVHYPSNYGFIPQTYCRDRDPLDILVLSQEPVVPGVVMKARPIGMLPMHDSGQEDFKVISVHANDPIYAGYSDISQLPPHTLREIRHFFEIYKELEKEGQVVVGDFRGRIDAHTYIRDSIRAYTRFRTRLFACEYPDY